MLLRHSQLCTIVSKRKHLSTSPIPFEMFRSLVYKLSSTSGKFFIQLYFELFQYLGRRKLRLHSSEAGNMVNFVGEKNRESGLIHEDY
jgi:hypothetical protein